MDFSQVDLVFMGGGPDREQKLASEQLLAMRDELAVYVEGDGPLLAICGGYQILGRQWLWGDELVPGLGLIDMETAGPAHLPTVSSTTWCWNLPWPRTPSWAMRTTPAAPTWARASRVFGASCPPAATATTMTIAWRARATRTLWALFPRAAAF